MVSAASSLCYAGSNGRLVPGRARELAALRTEWQRSTLGELRVALVLGLGAWAEALDLCAGGPDAAASCTEARRYHFVERIPGLLATASTDRPIVLVLDDAHRSDKALWQMLLGLARD